MTKSHVVEVSITNNTGYELTLVNSWFDSGRVADNEKFPDTIGPHAVIHTKCYESDWAIKGCSGWVEYAFEKKSFYFAFSNPLAGDNKVSFGDQTSIWNDMKSHYYPTKIPVQWIDDKWLIANCSSSGGTTNIASWVISLCDTSQVYPANIQLRDVLGVFRDIKETANRRVYYRCDSLPVSDAVSMVTSHFKGIARFRDHLIFTHTNVSRLSNNKSGAYMLADQIVNAYQGEIEQTFTTLHDGWPHPCSAQACGSYLAMGIQQSDTAPGSDVSEIQILDIRGLQVNQPAILIQTIHIPDSGVNGVGMTREAGDDGRYIVAGVNANFLTVWRSQGPSPSSPFTQILPPTAFEESGTGLALITQEGDGGVYILTINADGPNENSRLGLFKLDLTTSPPTCSPRLGTKNIPIETLSDSVKILEEYSAIIIFAALVIAKYGADQLNTSFRYGKGLAILSPYTIELYGSDRNVWPFSSMPAPVDSDKDFSVLAWSSSINGAPGWGIEGMRFRDASGQVYMQLDGFLRYIPNGATYDALFQDAVGQIVIDDLTHYNIGIPITDGASLARNPDNGAEYLLIDGTKRHIANPDTYSRFHFKAATSMSGDQLAEIIDGRDIY